MGPYFVAQFGISDTVAMNHWNETKVPDEKIKHSNKKGTISFARSSAETRGVFTSLNKIKTMLQARRFQ